jgi:hypothetical protein
MKRGTCRAIVVVLTWWGLMASGCSTASDLKPESLRSPQSARVIVEFLDPTLAQEGWSASQVYMAVAHALREAGLDVLTAEDGMAQPNTPYLAITVRLGKTELGLYRYTLSAGFVQEATQNPVLESMATVESIGELGTIGAEESQDIHAALNAIISRFVKTRLAAMPIDTRKELLRPSAGFSGPPDWTSRSRGRGPSAVGRHR